MNVANSLSETLQHLESVGLLMPSDAAVIGLCEELAAQLDEDSTNAALVREYRSMLTELVNRQQRQDSELEKLYALMNEGQP